MASKRHRTLKPARTSHDKMAVAHRHRIEEAKRVELATEIAGSKPVVVHCEPCDTRFVAAELNPACPECGQILVRWRTR